MTNLYYPFFIQIVERKIDGWFQPQKEICLNPNKRNVDLLNAEKLYQNERKAPPFRAEI